MTSGIVVVLAALAAQDVRADPARLDTVVMGIQARRGVEPALATLLTDVVQTTLAKDATRSVVGRADVARVLQLQADREKLGCADDGCLSIIAQSLDADRIVTGTLDQVDDEYLLVLTEIDAERLRPIARVEAMLPAGDRAMVEGTRRAADDMILQSRTLTTGGAPGTLSVRTTPAGALVDVAGRSVGRTPASARLPAGLHRVTIRTVGAPPAVVEAQVYEGANTDVELRFGVEVEPTEALREARDTRALWRGGLGIGKLVVGISSCAAGSLIASSGGFILLGYDQTMPDAPAANVVASACIACGSIGVLGGLGSTAWGAMDLIVPEEPLGALRGYEVRVFPPEGRGPPTFTQVPLVDEMAH